jgi:hypothetical protein
MDRFQVTPSLVEFFIDSGKTATLTNIGTATIYGAADAMFPNVGAAAWSLAPGATRVEDYGTLWVRTADGVSSTLTVDPVASGLAVDTGTGIPSAVSGGSGVPVGGSAGQVLTKRSVTDGDAAWAFSGSVIYGTGLDGDATITGTVTLTRDMHYNNLVLDGTIKSAGFRVFVLGKMSGAGTIQSDGLDLTGSGAPYDPISGFFHNGYQNAGQGAAGTTGTGTSSPNAAAYGCTLGGIGGAGGAGSSGAGGAAAALNAVAIRDAGVAAGNLDKIQPILLVVGRAFQGTGSGLNFSGGSGGGGGGGDGTNTGGGGAQGAGVVVVFAYDSSGFTGLLSAKGGNGGPASGGNAGGGGGGGGGFVGLYGSILPTGSYTRRVTGGTGGAKAGTGVNGTAGAAGVSVAVRV